MQVIPINCLNDNYCYMIVNNSGTDAVVIDPGEAYPVLIEMEKRGTNLVAILCTHHHHDHIGGVPDLLEQLPNLDVYAYYTEENRIKETNKLLTDGDQFTAGQLSFKAIYTPGHTKGSICYLVQDCLFTGDTVFGAGVGRLFEGTAEEMYVSIYDKICSLPEQTKLFFGHEYTMINLRFAAGVEPDNDQIRLRAEKLSENLYAGNLPSTLAQEQATNPFFRCDQDRLVTYLERKCGKELTGNVDVFREIRLLRNNFS